MNNPTMSTGLTTLSADEIESVSGGIAFTTAAAAFGLGLAAFGAGYTVGNDIWGD
jgi:lactobin A/cerein 7B family class IIb bacteriocin